MSKQKKPRAAVTAQGRIQRAIRAFGRLGLTLAVIAGAVLTVQLAANELGRRADAAPEPDAAQVIPVVTTALQRQTGYSVKRTFIGQVEPQKTTSLSFELPGRLDTVAVDEGDFVAAGQVLATQDISLLLSEKKQLLASKDATAARLQFAELTVTRRAELTGRGFTSQAGLDEALAQRDELAARMVEIDAALNNVEIRIEKSVLRAPFDGQVTDRRVDGNETLGAGQQVLGLVGTEAPQVRVGVPLDLAAEDVSETEIIVNGTTHTARLLTLRPDIDPVTRTRTALFEIDAHAPTAFGQTARLIVTETQISDGFWVPVDSLKEGTRGQWTVLTVDQDNTVRSASVEVLHAETARVYVRGPLPDGTELIGAGPQRVTPGQRVTTTGSE